MPSWFMSAATGRDSTPAKPMVLGTVGLHVDRGVVVARQLAARIFARQVEVEHAIAVRAQIDLAVAVEVADDRGEAEGDQPEYLGGFPRCRAFNRG